MKTVCVVSGKTFSVKDQLRDLGFKYHPGDKTWVSFEYTKEFLTSRLSSYQLSNVVVEDTTSTWYEGTSVDPEASKPTGYKPSTSVFSYKPGDQIEITGWIAKRLQKNLSMDFFFRNLELTEVLAETHRAVQVKFRFLSKIAESCHCCGRALDDEISRATGVGPVCLKRYCKIEKPNRKTAEQILEEIDTLVESVGEIGEVWIPKSRIKRKLNSTKSEIIKEYAEKNEIGVVNIKLGHSDLHSGDFTGLSELKKNA